MNFARQIRRTLVRVGELFHRRRRERELADELATHLALHAAEYERAGLPPEEARRRAQIKLGGLDAAAEACRDRRGLRWLDGLAQDLRFGLRQMRKARAFSMAAILTLALGLGATTAVFSLFQATLLEPLPYPQAHRLMSLEVLDRRAVSHGIDFGLARILAKPASLLRKLAVYTSFPAHVRYRQHTWNSLVEVSTPELFQLTATHAARGRLFDAGDVSAGRPVVVISHAFWRQALHGDPHAVGETLGVSSGSFTIVGILPAHARYPFLAGTPPIWLPISPRLIAGLLPNLYRGISPGSAGWGYDVLGRLASGATRAAAAAEFQTRFHNWLSARHTLLYDAQHVRVTLVPLAGLVSRPYRRPLWLLLIAAGLLLLIACVNLANLLSARVGARRVEIVTRAMLGAGRRELMRQWLVENLLLALPGAAAGWGLALAALRLSRSELPLGLGAAELALKPALLLAALGAGVAIALLLALLPAWQAGRWQNHPGSPALANLRHGECRAPRRMRQALTTAEIALSFMLLLSAGLLLHSLLRTLAVRPGFNPRRLLDAYIQLPLNQYKTHADWTRFAAEVLARLQARPAVASAAVAVTPPMLSGGATITQAIQNFGAHGPVGHPLEMALQPVSPGYFTTMQIPLLSGRDFRAGDTARSRRVCIINRALARQAFPGRNPLGKKLGNDVVIGVVGNTMGQTLTRPPAPGYFVPLAQFPVPFLHFLARTKTPAAGFVPEMRKICGADLNGLPIVIRPLESEIAHDASLSAERVHAWLTALLGLLGLGVAGMGIYSLLAYGVTQRRHELGVRSALGATHGQLVRLIVAGGLKLALVGGLIGLAAAWAFGRLLAGLLFQVSPGDLWSYLGAGLLLTGVALAASYVPARRAAKLDPLEALRYE